MASALAAKLASMAENHGDFPVQVDGYDIDGVWLMERDEPYYHFSFDA